MVEPIARQVFATGRDAPAVARALADGLFAPDLKIAFVFADRRLDPATIAGLARVLPAPVVGCSTCGVLGPGASADGEPGAVALGFYGDWVRVGVGVASELSKAALGRSHDAVHQAAARLGTTAEALEPSRHVAITLIDGLCNQEDAFCIGSAASAPKIQFVGGAASSDLDQRLPAYVWADGEVRSDAGIVIMLDSAQPFHVVSSAHLLPTELKTVVTAANGRVIEELDGKPAVPRLRKLLESIGDQLDEPRPSHSFARYIDGVPYVRSLYSISGNRLILASAVETGHILRVMRPGDLIQTTRRDLRAAADRVGGKMAALLAFSCVTRHAEAAVRGSEQALAATYAEYPTAGIQSLGEHSGLLLVNHTLTGLAIGAPRS